MTRRLEEPTTPEARAAWAHVAVGLARREGLADLPACARVDGLSWDRRLWFVTCTERGREWATEGGEACPWCGKEAK